MIFEGLSQKLQETIKKIRGKGIVNEKDVKEMMREIKLALLEADVNFKVVKEFIGKISDRAVGQDVLESLTPGQQIIKIVNEELVELLGSSQSKVTFSSKPPTVYIMVGLQGSGKTTTSGKLANLLRKQNKKPLLVACDVYRPAAVKQLEVVGAQLDVAVFSKKDSTNPIEIAKEALNFARLNQYDLLIIDTAGRLHIDERMMQELVDIKSEVKPQEILLVVDSMTGQDAVNVAESFDKKLGIDGIVLTKLDGDTRGGAALSVKSITGKPIKFTGVGEKLSDLEHFFPDRMASRILGMGDVLTLIDKAQKDFDEKNILEMERKVRTQQLTLEDFLDQMQQIKKMGPLEQIMGMLPGVNNKTFEGVDMSKNEKRMARWEAIIRSMTKQERVDTSILNASRRKRIALGSGTTIQEVNELLKSFEGMKKMMKTITDMGKRGRKGMFGMKLPF